MSTARERQVIRRAKAYGLMRTKALIAPPSQVIAGFQTCISSLEQVLSETNTGKFPQALIKDTMQKLVLLDSITRRGWYSSPEANVNYGPHRALSILNYTLRSRNAGTVAKDVRNALAELRYSLKQAKEYIRSSRLYGPHQDNSGGMVHRKI